MSRVQDALKKASEDREIRHAGSGQAKELSAGTQELWQEVHRLESSLANWTARQTVSTGSIQPAAPATPAPGFVTRPHAVHTWQETFTQCESALSACDAQIVRHLEEQALVEAQVAAQERAAAQANLELSTLRHRMMDVQGAVKSAEAGKAALQRKVDALRECQRLSDACAAADQELRTTDEMIAKTLDYQQRVTDKLAQYRQHQQTAQRTAEGLRHQLQQALVRAQAQGTQGERG